MLKLKLLNETRESVNGTQNLERSIHFALRQRLLKHSDMSSEGRDKQ